MFSCIEIPIFPEWDKKPVNYPKKVENGKFWIDSVKLLLLSKKLRLISLFFRAIGSFNFDSAIMSFLVIVESV